MTSFSKAYFTRNPIIIEDKSSQLTGNTPFELRMGGSKVYEGRYVSPARLDVSEIAGAFAPQIPEADGTKAVSGLVGVETADVMGKRTLSAYTGGAAVLTDAVCIPGGVSPQNYRRLRNLGHDIFTARLLDKRGNFFMTTRTHSWKIEIPEIEISPLYFINTEADDTQIRFRVPLTDMETEWPALGRGIYALDINGLRERIYDLHDFWPSVFDVYYGEYLSCRIAVTECLPSEQQTILKFRNSMGVFETVSLTGDIDIGYTAKESGEDERACFDNTALTFVRSPDRKRMQTTLTAESGHKTSEQFAFMLDMLASDEIYLKDRTGWNRVDATAEETTRKKRQTKPESMRVTLTFCDTSDNITPEIRDADDFRKPRIFSGQHTDEFN